MTAEQRRQLGMLVNYLKWSGLIFAGFLLIVLVKNQTLNMEYRYRQLSVQARELREGKRRLIMVRAALTDPVRIGKIAREQLGMIVPVPGQVKMVQIYEERLDRNERLSRLP